MSKNDSGYIEIGKLTATHALRGEVRCVSYSDMADGLLDFDTLYVGADKQPFEVEGGRLHKNVVLLKLRGIDDVQGADRLRGKSLFVRREDLAELPDQTYYIVDLVGLLAYLPNGELLGKIGEVIKTGARDVFDIRNEEGRSFLVPFTPEFVQDIDIEKGCFRVIPIEGLLDL